MSSRISSKLHDEHEATLRLAARVSDMIQSSGNAPPDPAEARIGRTLDELARAISGEVRNHFACEEDAIFPILRENGHGAMADLLTAEHRKILPVGDKLAALSLELRKGAINGQDWRLFCQLARQFFDELSAHIEKEEAGLAPLVDEFVDRDAEERILNEF